MALPIHHPYLTLAAQGIGRNQCLDHLLGRMTLEEETESLGRIEQIPPSLSGNGADTDLRMRHDGANSKILGLDGDAQILRFRISGHNGESSGQRHRGRRVRERSGGPAGAAQHQRKHDQQLDDGHSAPDTAVHVANPVPSYSVTVVLMV